MGAEHVWLGHAGDQALPAAHLQGASQALDCGKNLRLAESIEKALQGLRGRRGLG